MTDKFPLEIGGGVPLVSLTAIQVTHPASHQLSCVLGKLGVLANVRAPQADGVLPSVYRELAAAVQIRDA